jgi:hypothetical protein
VGTSTRIATGRPGLDSTNASFSQKSGNCAANPWVGESIRGPHRHSGLRVSRDHRSASLQDTAIGGDA